MKYYVRKREALTDEDMRELEHMSDPPFEQEQTDTM